MWLRDICLLKKRNTLVIKSKCVGKIEGPSNSYTGKFLDCMEFESGNYIQGSVSIAVAIRTFYLQLSSFSVPSQWAEV